MKILVVTSTFPRWAGDTDPTFVYELSTRLVDANTEVHVLAPHTRNACSIELLDGLTVHRFRYFFERWENLAYTTGILDKLRANPFNYLLVPFFLAGMAIKIYRLVRAERYTVVHAHWLIPQGAACAAAFRFFRNPPPLICTSHGGDLFGLRGSLTTKIKKWVIARSHTITVVSHFMRDHLKEVLAPSCVPKVLPMGVDLVHRFVPNPNVTRSANELIFVGRLVEKKGVPYLLQAITLVRERFPNVHLSIIGDGPLRKELEDLTVGLRIEENISFLGAVTQSELPRLYASTAIVIVPSIVARSGDQEGLGLVTVEAMGCGCAVVASDLLAIRDVVIPGENGLLAEPANSKSIAEKIIYLLEDETRLKRLQTVARASVLEKFDWEFVANNYRHLLQSAERPTLE